MGFEIIGIVIVGVWIGGWLDETYTLKGMGTAGAIIIGFIGWLLHVLMAVRAIDNGKTDGKDSPK
jgi:F0F1-type ATP synthase assembly protein I